MIEDRFGAFCRHTHVELAPTGSGVLDGLTFGGKDIFDVAGHKTGCGHPAWFETHGPANATAPAIARCLAAGARLVGKTHTVELAYSLSGENTHYGTPINPAAPDRVPGGSSSGSASAVAGGLCDFAIGSDTGGSVRGPASYCGIWGIRPTHDRVPLDGAMPLAPSFDTAGWFARDGATLALVGDVLLDGDDAPGTDLRALLIARDAFALCEPGYAEALAPSLARVTARLGSGTAFDLGGPEGLAAASDVIRHLQAAEAWASHRDWIEATKPSFGPGIAERIAWARTLAPETVAALKPRRAAFRERLYGALGRGHVIATPTLPMLPPRRGAPLEEQERVRAPSFKLLCAAGLSGVPQISIPGAVFEGCPVGLSLIGPPGSDKALLRLAAEIAA